MRITHEITLDFAVRGQTPVIPAVQGDENTRAVCIRLTDGGSEWPVPEDAAVMIRYRRPDGTGGVYDTLADGSAAWSVSGSAVTVILAPELLVLPGLTVVSAAITREEEVLGTFSFHVAITEDPSVGLPEADTYCHLGYSLTQLKAYVDERVAGVQCPLTVETVTAEDSDDNPSVPVTGLTLSQSALSLAEGNTAQLTCTVSPTDASNPTVTWETSDTAVATVENGLVTAVAAGECTVTVRSAENTSITAACTVTITAASGTVTVPLLSLDTLVSATLRENGGKERSLGEAAYVSFPYVEGMFISVYMNENWVSTYPAFLVKAPDGTETSIAADSIVSRVFTVTLSGYEAGSTVYVNIFATGGANDSNSYYQYETGA